MGIQMKYVEVLYHQKSWDINRNVSGNYWGLTGCIPQNVHVLCWEHYDQPVPYSQTSPVAQCQLYPSYKSVPDSTPAMCYASLRVPGSHLRPWWIAGELSNPVHLGALSGETWQKAPAETT